MTYTAFVFARGGSKGVLGKNLRKIAGKSLVQRAIEAANNTPEIGRVVVSTDSIEIANESRKFGAETPFMRPSNLATDESPELDSWRHALLELKSLEGVFPKNMVSVPTTAPLRLPEDLSACIRVFEDNQSDIAVVSTLARSNPYFNMLQIDSSKEISIPMLSAGDITRRQDAPRVHELTTVAYVANSEYILKCAGLFEGRVHNYEVDPSRAIDIDTELDLEIAEILLAKRERKS
jgi:N-acylneuraminate cytidylyltransferase